MLPTLQIYVFKKDDAPESFYDSLTEVYKHKAAGHNQMVLKEKTPDSGFDLMCIKSQHIEPHSYGNKVLLGVKCAMISYNSPGYESPLFTDNGVYNSGYYLYPRSSTGTKTTLRLANSVGIIDAGYRGEICAVFDNTADKSVDIVQDQRLVQICRGDLGPFLVQVVSSEEDLGITRRGSGGFGSTGQ